MAESKCLYGDHVFDPERGAGDHVLASRLFGEFEGDSTFRSCCVECNNQFGSYEQLLCQGSPLGLYRWYVAPNLGNRRGRGSLRQRGAKGASAPKFTMRYQDWNLLVHPSESNPLDATPVDQVVIRDVDGIEHHVRLFPNMTLERLRTDIEALGLTKMESAFVHCEPADADYFHQLLGEIFPKTRLEEQGITEPGNHRVQGRVEYRFSVGYFQALAKIAFHYYLMHGRRQFTGHEDLLAPIRDFIKCGGDAQRFFHDSGKPFHLPLGAEQGGKVLSPHNWLHVLALNEHKDHIVVHLQFYVGPGTVPPPVYVTLGSLRGYPALPEAAGARGHCYKVDLSRTDRFAGDLLEIPLTIGNRRAC